MKRSIVLLRALVLVLTTALGSGCGSDDEKDKQNEPSPSTGGDGGGSPTADAGLSPGIDGGPANAPSCPGAAPMSGSRCTAGNVDCRYGTTRCECDQATPLDAPGTWMCRGQPGGGGGMQTQCPMAEPAGGSACMNVRGECRYGMRLCDCTGANSWACWNPADCPMPAPAERAACSTVGMQCEYPQSGNNTLDCACAASGWNCGRQVCPPARPTVGGMCESGAGSCMFGDETCDCVDRAWSCWRASDCPTAAPAESSACTANGMMCSYGARGRCTCEGTRWDCSGIPRGDGGVRDGGAVVDASGIDASR